MSASSQPEPRSMKWESSGELAQRDLSELVTRLLDVESSNNSDELKEAFKDDWRIGMNMSVNFPLYSGNSLSSAQQRAELEKQKRHKGNV